MIVRVVGAEAGVAIDVAATTGAALADAVAGAGMAAGAGSATAAGAATEVDAVAAPAESLVAVEAAPVE